MHPRSLFPLLALATCSLLLSACALRDIRPEPLAETSALPADRVEEGRALLAKSLDAHGGLETWKNHRTARITLTDRWPGAITRAAIMPWPENGTTLQQDILLGTENSRLTFVDGDWKGRAWGIQNWATYTVAPGGEPKFGGDKDIWFWLPTVQYFYEAAFRLHEGQYVAHAGTRELHGKTYDLVYITWGSVEPSSEIDQYVAWIEQDTGRLGILQYTVRDFGKRIQGAAHYEDYKQVQGLWVPGRIRIADLEDKDSVLHMMTIESAEYGVDLPSDYFIPSPKTSASKPDKGTP